MLLATPWWVNLLILIPLASGYYWRRAGLEFRWTTLMFAAAFAAAFGFVEAATVDYLRGNVPDLPTAQAALANPDALHVLPTRLLTTETSREAATMIMLVAVALLGAIRARERWALFLWCFAIWDLAYYAGLRLTISWPASLRDMDVLFLIPKPWFAEIWFPILVSGMTLAAVVLGRMRREG